MVYHLGYGLPSDEKPQGEELLSQKGFQKVVFLFLQSLINFFPHILVSGIFT